MKFLITCIIVSALLLGGVIWFKSGAVLPITHSVSLYQEVRKEPTPVPSILPVIKLPPLRLENVFQEDHSWTASLSAEKKITVVATGDVLLARTVNAHNVQTHNFTWPFEHIAEVLRGADIAYINLETPLVKHCPLKNDGMIFCGDLRNIEGLQYAGIDVVNFANNHAGNYGEEGVRETIQTLTRAQMKVPGTSSTGPVYHTVKGITFAFLGYNEVDIQPGVNLSKAQLIQTHLTEARDQADVVIVQYHWGNEYTYTPTSHQRALAHFAIAHGADVVIGNHPHWIQPPEMYKDKFIMYSHGNFIFDQMWSRETREGVVGKYTFYDQQLVDVEFLPVWIEQYGQPRFMHGAEKSRILEILKRESPKLLPSLER